MPRAPTRKAPGAKKAPERVRAFAWTCNNYDAHGYMLEAFKHVARGLGEDGGWAVASEETGSEEETDHYQAAMHIGKHAAMSTSAIWKKVNSSYKDIVTKAALLHPERFNGEDPEVPPKHNWIALASHDGADNFKSLAGYPCKGGGLDPRLPKAHADAAAEPRRLPGYGIFDPWEGEIAVDAVIVWQWGTKGPGQGTRTDIQNLVAAATDLTVPLSKALLDDPELAASFIKYPNGVAKLRQHAMMECERDLDAPPFVAVFHGPTGTGKSFTINQTIKKLGLRSYTCSTGMTAGDKAWFDGYDGEEVVWFSEFRSSIQWSQILEILDRYAVKVQVKNGTAQMMGKYFFFCSPIPPSEWYPGIEEKTQGSNAQLLRRITHIVPMDGQGGQGRSDECLAAIEAVNKALFPEDYPDEMLDGDVTEEDNSDDEHGGTPLRRLNALPLPPRNPGYQPTFNGGQDAPLATDQDAEAAFDELMTEFDLDGGSADVATPPRLKRTTTVHPNIPSPPAYSGRGMEE